MAKPTLLYVIADSSPVGAPRQVYYLARALKNDYKIHCLCPEGWLADSLRGGSINVHTFKPEAPLPQALSQVRKIYHDVKPAVIHCHGHRGGLLGRLAANRRETLLVYTEHLWTKDLHFPNRFREGTQIAILKLLSRKTDHTIAVSQAVCDFLIARGIVADQSVSLIYGAIEPLPVAPQMTKPIIGTACRLTWVKGVDTLLKALPAVIEQFPGLTCRIVGNGPERRFLERMARNLNIEEHIEWVKDLPPDLSSFYSSLQVYVQPSLSEAFGMTTLEAMSAGIPVVAARAGALPEVVEDAVSGLFFPPGDYKELSHQITFLLSSPDIREKLRKRAIKQSQSFTIEKMAIAHRQLYNKLLVAQKTKPKKVSS